MSILDKASDTIAARAKERCTDGEDVAEARLNAIGDYLDEHEWVITNHQLAAAQVHIESLAGRLHTAQIMSKQYERFWKSERKKTAALEAELAALKLSRKLLRECDEAIAELRARKL